MFYICPFLLRKRTLIITMEAFSEEMLLKIQSAFNCEAFILSGLHKLIDVGTDFELLRGIMNKEQLIATLLRILKADIDLSFFKVQGK